MNKTIDNFSSQYRVQFKGKDIYQGEMEEMLLNYALFIDIFQPSILHISEYLVKKEHFFIESTKLLILKPYFSLRKFRIVSYYLQSQETFQV